MSYSFSITLIRNKIFFISITFSVFNTYTLIIKYYTQLFFLNNI